MPDLFVGDESRFFAAPASIDSLAALYARFPDATLVAGATDVGLWVTKQLRDLERVIWLGRVAGLDAIERRRDGALSLGAGVTLAEAAPLLAAIHPDLGELMRRFGSVQVRASGTVGGNIANGSPIGDLAPALIALGGRVVLRKGAARRTLPLEDFFLAYGKQDRGAGRVRARGRGAAPRGRPALSRPQGLEALRRGHFGRDDGRSLRPGRPADRGRAHRLRRHGGDAEARRRAPKRRWPARASTSRRAGATALARRSRTTSRP